jgi:hypothetical protein
VVDARAAPPVVRPDAQPAMLSVVITVSTPLRVKERAHAREVTRRSSTGLLR